MESAAYLELEGTLGAGGLEGFAGCVDCGYLARNYELARAVIVGAYHGAFYSGADFLYFLVGKCEYGCHGRLGKLAGLLHGVRAGGYQAESVLKAQRAGGYKCRKFAE